MLPGADGIELTGARPRAGRPAGHLPLRLRPGRDDRPGVGSRSRRLHRQALLADGADGESAGGPASAGGDGTLRAGRPRDPLRATPGAGGGPAGAIDGHGVRLAPRALGQRGTGADQRGPAPAGVGRAGRGRRLRQGTSARRADDVARRPRAAWTRLGSSSCVSSSSTTSPRGPQIT